MSAEIHTPAPRIATILIIDDHEDLLLTWALLMELHGFHVETARDGIEGLCKAQKKSPSLIVTDYSMPGLDGVAVCRAIRADEALDKTPIILWTAGAPVQVEGLANVALRKPVSIEIMLEHIERLLGRV